MSRTFSVDLQSLRLDVQPQVFRYRLAVPFHERGVYLEYFFAIDANDLGLEVFRVSVDGVELGIAPHVDFPDDAALGEKGQAAIDGGPRDGFVYLASFIKKVFGGEVIGQIKDCLKNAAPLPGYAQAFA